MLTAPTRLIACALLAAGGLAASGCQVDLFAPIAKQQAIDHFVTGQLKADKGDVDAALKELAAAVKADPTLSVAHSAMGDIHRKRGDWQQAQQAYEQACDTNPYAFRPHYNLGVVYQHQAGLARTIEQAQKLLRYAVDVYLRATTLEPEDYDASLNLSACYFALGKHAQAEKYCKAAIALEPMNPAAHTNLGVIYESQGRFDEAVKSYKNSLERDVNQPRVLINMGTIYLRQDQQGAALQAFQAATKADPDSSEAWQHLGNCHYQRKDYAEAMRALDKSVAKDPSNASAHRAIGVVCMTQYLLDTQKAQLREQALTAWNRSIEIQPGQDDLLRLVQKYTTKIAKPNM
jgi:tetratricopeptide (TPR) repeat protein